MFEQQARALAKSLVPYLPAPVTHRMARAYTLCQLPARFTGPSLSLSMSDRSAGFFSLFFQVLGAIDLCRRYQHNLDIAFTKGPYVDHSRGGNWWSYYFDPSAFEFSSTVVGRYEITDLHEQHLFAQYGSAIPAAAANKMISGMSIRADVLRKAQAYVDTHFAGRRVIGIHYRGTDKVTGDSREAVRVPYSYVIKYLEGFRDAVLFVATDESSFVSSLKEHFGTNVVCYDAIRSDTRLSIHSQTGVDTAFKAGEDALIDCLLLSRCHLLARTDSNLSLASTFFNPRLPTINLTRKYARDIQGTHLYAEDCAR
jgi:hypothetical protein